MRDPIILIGPIGAGKTTIGKLLAEHLSLPFHSLDEEAARYMAPLGYSDDEYDRIKEERDLSSAYEFARSFFDEAVVKFLEEYTEGIFDFGGGHPVVPDAQKQTRIKEALKSYKNIILLMPTPDIEESMVILRKRNEMADDDDDFNKLYFKDRTFWDIAKHIVYTEGKTPEQTMKEILDLVL